MRAASLPYRWHGSPGLRIFCRVSLSDVSPVAWLAGAAILLVAVAWPVAGEQALDRIDAALTRDEAGCARSGDRAASDLRAAEAATFCLLNHRRREHGLPPLARDRRIDAAARAHSRDMAARRFHAHESPDGTTPLERMRRAGWPVSRTGAAENIAWGAGGASTPAEIVEGWMNSPAHRANILDPRLRTVGVGIAAGAPEPVEAPDPAIYTTDFA